MSSIIYDEESARAIILQHKLGEDVINLGLSCDVLVLSQPFSDRFVLEDIFEHPFQFGHLELSLVIETYIDD